MSKLKLEHLMVGPLQSNCFLLADTGTREVLVIDPGGDGEMIVDLIRQRDWTAIGILNTHAHFDHTAANAYVKKATGAPLAVPRGDAPLMGNAHMAARVYGLSADPSPEPDRLLDEGDSVALGGASVTVLSTPGHTPGGATFVSDLGIFPGDALFAGSIGRTDLPGGDFHTLIRSIKEKILTMDDNTPVYPGHGPATTVGRERRYNPFLTG